MKVQLFNFFQISITILLHQTSADNVEMNPTSNGAYNMKSSFNSWEAAGYRPASYENHQNSYEVNSQADQYDHSANIMITNNNGYQYDKPTDNVHMELPYSQTYDQNTASDNSQYETIPISEHIEIMKPVPVPSIRHVPVPFSKPYHISVPYPVIVPVPQPYPVKVPVYKPVPVAVIKEFQIPIEKLTPYPVVKNIPYPVSKGVPYNVEKEVKVNVPQPYPVKIPIIKTIIHSSKDFGKGDEIMDYDHHMFGEYGGFEDFGGHDDIHGGFEEHYNLKHDDKKNHKMNGKNKWDNKHEGFMMHHKYNEHNHQHKNKKSSHKKLIRVVKHEGPKYRYQKYRKNARDGYETEYY